MATYFTARKAEKVFTKYKALVIGYWDAQPPDNRGWMGRNAPAPEGQESIALREQIVSLYPEANSYANALGLSVTAHNYPPPAVGGPVIPVNLLYGAVDRDAGHSRLPKQTVLDTINRCLATATATRKRLLWSQLLNPVWWATETIAYVLRIPFVILRKAGLPASVEESVWGHVIKVAIFALLVLASLHWRLKLSPKNLID